MAHNVDSILDKGAYRKISRGAMSVFSMQSLWNLAGVSVTGLPRRIVNSSVRFFVGHYSDVITGPLASQITSLTIVFSAVYSGEDQRKHQSSASLAFVLGIHRWPVNSPHKWPVTRKMFPLDDVIMCNKTSSCILKQRCILDSIIYIPCSDGTQYAPRIM